MPKSPKNNKSKGKKVCRRTTVNDNVSYAGEGRKGHHEPRGEQLRVVQPIGGRRNGLWFEPPLLRDGRLSNPGHLLTVQVLESEPNNQASSKRRDRKAKPSPKAVRSRRVVLDNPPNRNAGTNRGQATSVPLHDSQSCLLYTSPSPRDLSTSRMPSSA